MKHINLNRVETRLLLLERRLRLYRWLLMLVGLGLVISVSLAAQVPKAVPAVVQAGRFEVVHEAGRVMLAAYATKAGGRLDIFNHEGQYVFSAGTAPDGTDVVGLWEQTRTAIERQRQELEQQRRLIDNLSRQPPDTRQARQAGGPGDQLSRELDQLRRDVDQQRREVGTVERQVQSLAQQVRSLERR